MHTISNPKPSNRLLSLDFMRGLIMFLLALEACELYSRVYSATDSDGFGRVFISQFFHNGWNGLHFWDLIQPAFMFMAGIAMAYSLTRQIENGVSWIDRLIKVLRRCGWLLFWGVFKRISSPDWFAWNMLDVTDILTQLAFTTLIAFLLFNLAPRYQLLCCVGILLITELLYRFWGVPDFDNGYTAMGNFGNWVDWILFGQKANTYVFINWLPTAVHTVAGVMVGKLFISANRPINGLVAIGIASLIVGYAMDILQITPIIKPIATSSFIIASLGYCLLIVAALYWWIDVRKNRKGLLFFQVIGMNSIFIYLFFSIVGAHWLNEYVLMIVSPIFAAVGLGQQAILLLSSICVFTVEWLICLFLYRKKIFFKV
ncbi:acyltransferase family protein [Sphingobacterium shayense]|uniref:acyltransferase family protein n=1 Tax=Sphingobacterium shayense TaxID=626343 RepID=UPI001C12EBD3|nr:DUF5009 domain-containing protein [Sphingobacterium shayense]